VLGGTEPGPAPVPVAGGRTCCRTGQTEGRRASAAVAVVGFLTAAVGRSEVDPGTVEVVV